MYYLFGAGSFCSSVVSFCGKDSIIAIVDNNCEKWNKYVDDIKIISLDECLSIYKGEKIIITAQFVSSQIKKQLLDNGITNVMIFPYIQTSIYTASEIIEHWKIDTYSEVFFYGNNVLSSIIKDKLENVNVTILENLDNELHYEDKKIFLLDKLSIDYKRDNIINVWGEMEREFQEKYNMLLPFKNKYLGKRCFLIGNGPSLNPDDLEKLHMAGEITFACNRIHLIFDKTNWRPTFYFLIDGKEYKHNEFMLKQGNQINFIKDFIGCNNSDYMNTFYFRNSPNDFSLEYVKFSEEISIECYAGCTTTYEMLQFAIYMGFEEIYLLGVDFSWGEDGKNAHFDENYGDNLAGLIAMKENKYKVLKSYKTADEISKKRGVKIYNATRGGYLEVFERLSFDDIIMGE